LLAPALAGIVTAFVKAQSMTAPEPVPLSLTGLGAMVINLTCALMLARYRDHHGGLTKAAFLSARNDVLANIAIILAGVVTAWLWHSPWPDIIVGVAIGLLNADAARQVWQAARGEHEAAA
jgi:Co/Zn/Cd efflux system component